MLCATCKYDYLRSNFAYHSSIFRSLDDDSISEELKKLKLRKGPLTTRNLSTRHIRSIRNSRLRFRAKSSAAGAQPGYRKETLGVQPGKFLSAEQEAHLVSRWQVMNLISNIASKFVSCIGVDAMTRFPQVVSSMYVIYLLQIQI